ncbi:porin family protein [Roseibium denhamense]|uniref:Outer membrane immunogenic protein n=1 Tax=Roseibium denhamense TaxID=76305 RepID=A0ABY1NF73_9HYPH|nr:outer membrane protein [Roseibium denhamense]MTI04266.1 porin family protein [Roseibium denhamense]SMP07907.1 outer membrane immunogenic protein [Roseibium denhamense]
MKRLALAGLTLATMSAAALPALAADLPQTPAPSYEPVPAGQQTIDWTGVYVGGNLGWSFGQFDNRAGGGVGDIDITENGVSGGVFAGYNLQVTPNIVVGGEADFTLSDLEDSRTRNGLNLQSGSDWNSNFRGRVGYAFDRYLIYGAGGLAIADVNVKGNGDKDSKTALGWTLGAGAEGALTNNVTARFEYVYQDFGEQDFNLGGQAVSSDFNNQQVRFGLGYKF